MKRQRLLGKRFNASGKVACAVVYVFERAGVGPARRLGFGALAQITAAHLVVIPISGVVEVFAGFDLIGRALGLGGQFVGCERANRRRRWLFNFLQPGFLGGDFLGRWLVEFLSAGDFEYLLNSAQGARALADLRSFFLRLSNLGFEFGSGGFAGLGIRDLLLPTELLFLGF